LSKTDDVVVAGFARVTGVVIACGASALVVVTRAEAVEYDDVLLADFVSDSVVVADPDVYEFDDIVVANGASYFDVTSADMPE